MDKIKCPVLVLRAMFDNEVLNDMINNYVKPQFIDCWNDVSAINPLITVQDIENAATFVWKDNPKATYKAMNNFIKQH